MRYSVMAALAAGALGLTGCEQIREALQGGAAGGGGSAAGPVDLAAGEPTTQEPQGPGTIRVVVSRPAPGETAKEDRSSDAYCAQQQPAAAGPSAAVVRIVDDMPAQGEVEGEPWV